VNIGTPAVRKATPRAREIGGPSSIFNNQLYSVYSSNFPITTEIDQTYDENVIWNVADPANSITTLAASIEAVDDPVNGY